jgi:hypothetical protein
MRQIAGRVSPFVAIVVLYLLSNFVVIYIIFQTKPLLMSVANIRPFYSLLAGWTVFFIGPEGRLSFSNPMIYATALFIPATFFPAKERRLLLFGYCWVFFAFLPQSLTGMSQFKGEYIVNSLGRHLYLPSIGASLVLAVLLVSLRERMPLRLFGATCMVVLALYCGMNYLRVQERGKPWQDEGENLASFIREMKRILPVIPVNSYITISNPPEGRAFTQSSLRAFYKNPRIFWKDDYRELKSLPPDAYGIYIDFDWVAHKVSGTQGKVYFVKTPFISDYR